MAVAKETGMPDEADKNVAALINTHVERYPEIDILDVYKLLHQAVFGPGHAIKNERSVQEVLEVECELLTPDVSAPLVENVHPDSKFVRLHLRPYLAARGDVRALLKSFVQSANAATGELAMMAAWWAIFEGMIAPEGALAGRFDTRVARLEGRTHASEQWPASHHSPRFERVYHPAYRVLAYPIAESMLSKQKIGFEVI
jgi:hypothetical protein